MYWCLCWTGVLLWKPHAVCDRDWHTGTWTPRLWRFFLLQKQNELLWCKGQSRTSELRAVSRNHEDRNELNATPQVALCVTAVHTGSVQSTLRVSVGTSGWFGDLAPMLPLNKWLGSLYVWAACVVTWTGVPVSCSHLHLVLSVLLPCFPW